MHHFGLGPDVIEFIVDDSPLKQGLFTPGHHIPVLPSNVFVVPPESGMSTYALMSLCNAAIIYGTKMGVELTSVGLPVIVAGEAWIRNKGLTHDASTPAEYFEILRQLPFPARLAEKQLTRARRYAYHFFFSQIGRAHV